MSKKKPLKKALGRFSFEFRQRYLLTLLAISVSIALLAIYFWFNIKNDDPIWANIFASGVSGCWIFIVVYLVLERQGVSLGDMDQNGGYGALIEFYPGHENVDWSNVLSTSKRIDIVVYYYGGWARENYDELVKFFGRGGQLRVVMADPERAEAMDVVHQQFFPNLKLNQLLERIAETEQVLRQAYSEAACARALIDVYYFPLALHYSFVLTNGRHLYLSVYEQFRSHVVKSSVFHIDLAKDSSLEEYWEANLQAFIKGSRTTPAVTVR